MKRANQSLSAEELRIVMSSCGVDDACALLKRLLGSITFVLFQEKTLKNIQAVMFSKSSSSSHTIALIFYSLDCQLERDLLLALFGLLWTCCLQNEEVNTVTAKAMSVLFTPIFIGTSKELYEGLSFCSNAPSVEGSSLKADSPFRGLAKSYGMLSSTWSRFDGVAEVIQHIISDWGNIRLIFKSIPCMRGPELQVLTQKAMLQEPVEADGQQTLIATRRLPKRKSVFEFLKWQKPREKESPSPYQPVAAEQSGFYTSDSDDENSRELLSALLDDIKSYIRKDAYQMHMKLDQITTGLREMELQLSRAQESVDKWRKLAKRADKLINKLLGHNLKGIERKVERYRQVRQTVETGMDTPCTDFAGVLRERQNDNL